jgi:hypothetical protein
VVHSPWLLGFQSVAPASWRGPCLKTDPFHFSDTKMAAPSPLECARARGAAQPGARAGRGSSFGVVHRRSPPSCSGNRMRDTPRSPLPRATRARGARPPSMGRLYVIDHASCGEGTLSLTHSGSTARTSRCLTRVSGTRLERPEQPRSQATPTRCFLRECPLRKHSAPRDA